MVQLAMVTGVTSEPDLRVRKQESWQANKLKYLSSQIQGFELVHPNNYPINELLKYMRGLVFQIQNNLISMIQGNDRISKKNPSEVSIFIEYQKL